MEKSHIYPEDWRTLQRIADGSKIAETETPLMGMKRSFTVGKGRTHWNSDILDNFAAHGYIDRKTNAITATGLVALMYRQIKR